MLSASKLMASIIWCVPVLGLASLISVAISRLFFGPLSKIPGPKVAAVTHLYKTYFNATGGSKFYLQIEKLHQEYGPVVRISPDEVHLSDPDNHNKIYYGGTRFSKSPGFYSAFGYGTAAFSTPGNELHRVRRSALNPLFSRKRVMDLEEIVHTKVAKVDRRLRQAADDRTALDLHYALRAISVDTITDYAFGNCYNLLDRHDFGIQFFETMRELGPAVWFFQQWPFLQSIALAIPPWLAKVLSTNLGSFMQLQQECRDHIVTIKAHLDAGEKQPAQTTMFHQLLDPKATEGHVVPTIDDMRDESFVMLSAAADTTGNAMTIAMCGAINDPVIYSKVVAELSAEFPDPSSRLDFLRLEKLPYLTAVIKEGLRLSYGVIGRLPRVVPSTGATFNGLSIPAGFNVGMSSYMMHRDEKLFPDPDRFDPERWTDPVTSGTLDGYLIPFSRGPRQCIGMQLAYCEVYVTLGTLLRRFQHLKTLPLSEEDLQYEDYFAPYRPVKAKKVHVVSE